MRTIIKDHYPKISPVFLKARAWKFMILWILGTSVFSASGQTSLEYLPQSTYHNLEEAYNYTFWDDSFKESISDSRKFSIQTSAFSMNINYDDLDIQSLNINSASMSSDKAFAASKSAIFSNEYAGAIDYAILQDDIVIHEKNHANATDFGNKDSQMAEFGTWLNRRIVSTTLTNSAPVQKYFTGVEFTNWHNRIKLTFHVRPTVDIINGQLQFSIDLPAIYGEHYNDGSIYGFANEQDQGFAVKQGITAAEMAVTGNAITVTTQSEDLLMDEDYSVSIIVYAITDDLSTTYTDSYTAEIPISISADQTAPNTTGNTTISYDEDEGLHYLNTSRYSMGYRNCDQADILQNIELTLTNESNIEKTARLCFRQIPNVNVVGFNSLIRNENGDPSGLPLQVSKNWHTSTAQLFSGSWIREYTEIIIPANTIVNIDYTRTGAKWGETFSASSHQLSVVGSGVPKGGWLEASLGSFGETITHSPDYLFGNSNACDVRPFMLTNEAYQGTSAECNWTGNVGGLDMWVYVNSSGQRIYQKQTKTRFQRYSPNLSETSLSAISSDEKLKLDYSFYLNRSDDFVRIYYKVKIKALEDTPFNRLDVFQLGGDRYNYYASQVVKYGDDSGVIGEFNPTNSGSNNYTTDEVALTGNRPWVWAGDGKYTKDYGGINIDTNNGMIITDYSAQIGGAPSDTPYFRERSSSQGFSASTGLNPTSYCLVLPPGTSQLMAGDSIELLVETIVLPKLAGDYYGPNINFDNALSAYGNSVELFLREVQGNAVRISSDQNQVDLTYPYSIGAINNTAQIEMTGGKGYVPLIFTGVTDIKNPQLWKATDSCWELVDQSEHGKDFWQADFQSDSGTYDLVYNVNQDTPNDSIGTTHYYLGNIPPNPIVEGQSNINNQGWTLDYVVQGYPEDSIHFVPIVTDAEGNPLSQNGTWSWTGPNGFSASSSNIIIPVIDESDLGLYILNFTSFAGCMASYEFEIQCAEQTEILYDGVDNDCNAATLDDDLDQDGFVNADDCDDSNAQVNSSQAEVPYDGVDNDCDATTLDDDLDQDGYANGVDCDDTNAEINPVAEEIPNNGVDENCDGMDLVSSTFGLLEVMIMIYPNPAQDIVNIDIEGQSNYETSLFSLDGKLLKEYENNRYFKIKDLPSGIYFLEVKDTQTGKKKIEKLVVER